MGFQGKTVLAQARRISSRSGYESVFPVETANGAGADRTKVVLNEDANGSYELKSIWLEGQEFGFGLE